MTLNMMKDSLNWTLPIPTSPQNSPVPTCNQNNPITTKCVCLVLRLQGVVF